MTLPPNVILLGFMGAGKTSTGVELARLLNFEFIDTDHWIEEKNGKKISQLFEDEGEIFFRDQEKKAIEWLGARKHFVVSIGGGAWMNDEIRTALLRMGWCVWLKVSAEKAWQRTRVNLSQRPILSKSDNPLELIQAMLREREPYYAKANISFDTVGKSPKEIANEISRTLNEEHPFDLPKM